MAKLTATVVTSALCVLPVFIFTPTFALSLGGLVSVLWVVLGLGLVIFFHELGHFAVAKWCDVKVERFSIGFGPVLWSTKRGETEYALSAIPFGGYVKMLGQDDMDPSQMSNEEIAEDPRSYSAKSVPQRMAIISAGVIMNIITGMLFFAIAFGSGVRTTPSVLGGTRPGYPAWKAGLDYGYRIDRIDDREIETFGDIMRGVALTDGDLTVHFTRRDGSEGTVQLTPDGSGTRRLIGASPMVDSLKLIEPFDASVPLTDPGSPASAVEDQFRLGDELRRIAIHGEEPRSAGSIGLLQQWLAQEEVRPQPVDFYVKRNGEIHPEPITVGPAPFRTLGLGLDITKITAVVDDSPAAKAGLKVGDKITHVDGRPVGTDLDPLRLPDYFYSRRVGGQQATVVVDGEEQSEVIVVVSRPQAEGGARDVTLRLQPADAPGWTDLYNLADVGVQNIPVAVPAIGIAYHVIPYVLHVHEGSPAEKAGVKKGERIQKMHLVHNPKLPDQFPTEDIEILFGEKDEDDKSIMNWAYAFRLMQRAPARNVRLTVVDEQGQTRLVNLIPANSEDWFQPSLRGIRLEGLSEVQEADTVLAAVQMGFEHTKNSAIDIYLTLRNLIGGRISPKELHGPVGIAKVAYNVAEQGLPQLLLFLGFLSVNLAVLNFLPIPVLDGGHMVFLIWEGVTRSKPSEKVLHAAQFFGFLFIVALMLFVLFQDIFVHRHIGN